ncbi:MAG: NrtR-regulated hypothetical OrfY [Daejeonella sp.]|nr:NrtR-regulated hypothetical OrfY [Daejeonella sp.]
MSIEYAILVKNKTRLEVLIERFNTKPQAQFYIERSGGDFSDYELEHNQFHTSLTEIQRMLSKVIKNKIVDRAFLPSFLFNHQHLVVVVGQDGLVANTAKYVNGIPIIAVNPDIERYDGLLLPFTENTFITAVEKVISNTYKAKTVKFAEAVLADGQRLLAFNDLFLGASSHVSARYKITYQNVTENHSSSGVIVSTQAGSTGWLSSVFNMSFGVQKFIEKSDVRKKVAKLKDNQLMFVVREPFASRKTQTNLTVGLLTEQYRLVIESFMPSNGVIFSDGIESDFLQFNSGAIASIGLAKETANLVV